MHPRNITDARHVCFPVVSTTYTFRTESFISLSPDINFAILPKYYLFLITENYMWPLVYCPVQFPVTTSNPPLAVDLRNCDFVGHYSTFVPFPKQSSANCSRWNITASSLIKSCCYIFQSLSSVCFHATKKNLSSRGVVFNLPPLRGKFSMLPLSLICFKQNFWIVLLLMPVIFCIL